MSKDGNLAKPYACNSDDGEWLGCWRRFVLCRSQFTQSPPGRVRSLVSGRRAAGGPGWDARSVLVLSDSPRPAVLGRCFGFLGRGLSVCPPGPLSLPPVTLQAATRSDDPRKHVILFLTNPPLHCNPRREQHPKKRMPWGGDLVFLTADM